MMNPLLQEALIREHQRAMQRVEDDARRVHEARRAMQPQPLQSQPAKHPHPACMPRPAIDMQR